MFLEDKKCADGPLNRFPPHFRLVLPVVAGPPPHPRRRDGAPREAVGGGDPAAPDAPPDQQHKGFLPLLSFRPREAAAADPALCPNGMVVGSLPVNDWAGFLGHFTTQTATSCVIFLELRRSWMRCFKSIKRTGTEAVDVIYLANVL